MQTLKPIYSRLEEIERLQSDLDAERQELLIALKVCERLGLVENESPVVNSATTPNKTAAGVLRNRDCLLQALTESGNPWLTAAEVQELASAIKGSEIPMSSISPGLTELKNESLIERRGLRVALVSRANEEYRQVTLGQFVQEDNQGQGDIAGGF